ncbi:MAG TPA: glycosyl transferase family protein [Acidobacteriota bacterium]|nr:glycosyl transferase family protein [Acidobacteriota bacterium]
MSFPDLASLVPYFLVTAQGLLIAVSLVFLVSGIDDFFIDLYYLFHSLYRRFFIKSKHRALSQEDLAAPEEKPIAVMIPAWHESAVIRRMLQDNLKRLNYSNYYFFVGTYPNDPETGREVEIVREQSTRVHRVVCPHNGPTNKSDCLNWVIQGIRLFEKENNIDFEILVLSDSEDVAHPLVLKLFNCLIPRFDMVQLPVIPLEPEWHHLVGGHYLDEFAEFHSKDILVREYLTGSLPSAGVGTGFSRRTIDLLSKDRKDLVFNIRSLTEDYDLGLSLPKYGLKQIFVKHSIDRIVTRKSLWTGKPKQVTVKDYVAIREFFPTGFSASVRQKARWVVGICFQGWANLGWFGNFWNRYFLFRDRKALWNNPAGAACYILVGIELFFRLRSRVFPESYQYPTLVASESWQWKIILIDTFFLFQRLVQRVFWTYQLYNWRQALLAVPRLFVSNLVNFTATGRALRLYTRYLRTGRITWEKTDHRYPSEAASGKVG